jgi:DNA-binding GntR family transcriptional regulator
LSIADLCDLTRARIVVETATLRESVSRGNMAWEADVVVAHHKLASTPMHANDGSINTQFTIVHRAFHAALLAGGGNSHPESVATTLRDRAEIYLQWSPVLGHDTDRDVAV